MLGSSPRDGALSYLVFEPPSLSVRHNRGVLVDGYAISPGSPASGAMMVTTSFIAVPHLEHERGIALGFVATVPRSLR